MRASYADPSGLVHLGLAQLEVPFDHGRTWQLLPLRKPLLTKRSRRCRLLTYPPAEAGAGKPEEGKEASQPSSRPRGQACGRVVVKPQISPCSNPPFQKNNVAVAFIPRCLPFAWAGEAAGIVGRGQEPKAAEGGRDSRVLAPGERAEVVFTLANPLDTDVQVSFDPVAFNPGARAPEGAGRSEQAIFDFAAEQNVEVLTQPFKAEVEKLNDLAEAHEVWGEDTPKTKELREKDDKDVLPDRKLHKLLVRLRFRGLEKGKADTERPWVFFVRLEVSFEDNAGARHNVGLVVRFALEKPRCCSTTARYKLDEAAGQGAAAAGTPAEAPK